MTKEVLLENLKQYPTVLQQLIYLTNVVGDISEIADYDLATYEDGSKIANDIFNEKESD